MNHKDKNKGTRRQKTGALLVIPIFFNLYLFAWEAKRVGDEGRLPPTRSLWFVPPQRSLAETLELALALLPVSAVTLMLAGAIAEGAGKEIEALRQRIDAQQKAIQKLQYQVHHRD